MKKFILGIAVIAFVFISIPVHAAQANQDAAVTTEVTNDDYVQVNFKDLPEETQELLVKEFEGYVIKTIYQHVETKLLKVVVTKDDEEKTFVQNDEGKFVEK